MTLETVKVPEAFRPLFEQAEGYVRGYFDSLAMDPKQGTITIGGERYVLVRATSLSVNILEQIRDMYPGLNKAEAWDAAARVLFDLAHTIGRNDAEAFHRATGVTDPIAKLSTGPVHFAHTGWAFVDILPESKPSPDDDYYLIYDHPHSFEADAWVAARDRTDHCVCFMNAGYSAGWCEQSFGVELRTREILCRARGDEYCRFIMAPPGRLDDHIRAYARAHPEEELAAITP